MLSIRKPAPDHRPSRLPVQEPLVLLILLILCIHVHKNYRFPGAVAFDPSGGEGQAGPGYGAGGTPALPGGLHPMTGSHQGGRVAGAFRCRLWLKEVRQYSCLFVFIRGSSLKTTACYFLERSTRQGRHRTGWNQSSGPGFAWRWKVEAGNGDIMQPVITQKRSKL